MTKQYINIFFYLLHLSQLSYAFNIDYEIQSWQPVLAPNGGNEVQSYCPLPIILIIRHTIILMS